MTACTSLRQTPLLELVTPFAVKYDSSPSAVFNNGYPFAVDNDGCTLAV